MKIADTGGGVDFEPCPAGNHIARCVSVVDLGTREHDYFGQKSMKHEIYVMWEIPHELKKYTNSDNEEVEEPFTISRFYTASLSSKSHTRADLESWRGKPFTEEELQGFEVKNILGKPCMLNVIHKQNKDKTRTNARVQSVNQMPKGLDCPAAVNDLTYFSLDPEEYSQESLDALSDGLKKMVMGSEEYIAMMKGNGDAAADDHRPPVPPSDSQPEFDDIPF